MKILLDRLMKSSLTTLLGVTLAAAPLVPTTARAATAPEESAPSGDVAKAEALSSEAVTAFEAKDFEEAVRLFEEAYAANPEPNYLFNIGRVYEELGDLRKAVEFYQQFVGQAGVDLNSREKALERLKVLREAIDQLEADQDDEDTDPVPGGTTGPTEDEAKEKRRKQIRISGYALLGVGGLSLIVGGIVGGVALQGFNDAEDEENVDERLDAQDDVRTTARAADGLLIAGGVVAAAGLILVLTTLGKRKASASASLNRRTAWAPVLGKGQAGLSLTHKF